MLVQLTVGSHTGIYRKIHVDLGRFFDIVFNSILDPGIVPEIKPVTQLVLALEECNEMLTRFCIDFLPRSTSVEHPRFQQLSTMISLARCGRLERRQ